MTIDQKPPALLAKISMEPRELEEKLWSAYRLGVASGLKKAGHDPRPEPIMPQCPKHPKVPLWLEAHATADGSWLYCSFCRQDAQAKKTDTLRALHPVRLMKEKKL